MRIANRLTVAFVLVATSAWAPSALANGNRLFRGLTFALSPSVGTIQNGPLPDQNIFRQRFTRNYIGDGYGYEFTRIFGADSYGNTQQFDAGPANVALAGTMHNSIQVNKRFLPEIKIASDTGGAAMNYAFRVNTGAQDASLSGAFNGNFTASLNALGFYEIQAAGTNTGTRTASGMLATDNQKTDFDVGPINVVGNVYWDLASNIFQAFGNTISATDTNIASAASARAIVPDPGAKSADGSSGSLAASAHSDAEQQKLFTEALIKSILFQSTALLTPDEQNALLNAKPTDASTATNASSAAQAIAGGNAQSVPEPGTLLLFALPLGLMLWRRAR